MAAQTKGYCKYCGKEYTRGGMLRHLVSCKDRNAALLKETGKECGHFELLIYHKYEKTYWLIIEMPETAKLSDLDQFLRDIWLECCGHLSCFQIEWDTYEVLPDKRWNPDTKSMNCTLRKVLSPGMVFSYEYDYGSTTELVIEVKNYRPGKRGKEKVTILSRNQMPEYVCNKCGKNPAAWVNPMGYYDGEPFWCEDCYSKAEEEGEEETDFFLPVCNSPRMGVCAYTGSSKYNEEFVPDVNPQKKNG